MNEILENSTREELINLIHHLSKRLAVYTNRKSSKEVEEITAASFRNIDDTEYVGMIIDVWKECGAKEDFFWFLKETDEVTAAVNCNDFFDWGTSDCVMIEPEDIPLLRKTFQDLKNIGENTRHCWSLFAARKEGCRPQGAYYSYFSEKVAKLFDEVGPEREINICNPYPNIPGENNPYVIRRKKNG